MQYTIKNFENDGDKKFVGFFVTDAQGNIFAIDKRIPLQDGKTNEQYITEALALCADQIAEWQERYTVIGKVFDPATGTFVDSSAPVVETPVAGDAEA